MPRVRKGVNWQRGRVERLIHSSKVLQDNPWRDPVDRNLCVYLPHGYSESASPLPALWDLAAFTNSGPGHVNWRNHGENLPERLDRLIGVGNLPPVVVVMPDCYTSLGGNQYVNSPAVGRYADYVVEELVPFVSGRFNVVDSREGRGAFGKSSGGYGALYMAMHFPDTWGAVASHAGDAGFEWLFLPEFPTACGRLNEVGGDVGAFIRGFWEKNRPMGKDFITLMILAMAASYDPDPDSEYGIRLPFDLETMELNEEAWNRWLEHDPVNMIDHADRQAALKRSLGIYIDVGWRDQYNIQYGTRRLHRKLGALDIDHRYEEFDGTHSGIDWRLETSLPWLAERLSAAPST